MITQEQQQVMIINTLYALCGAIRLSQKDGLSLIAETAALLAKVSDCSADQLTLSQVKALSEIKNIFDKAQACAASTSIQH
jgi:hypothetical protein